MALSRFSRVFPDTRSHSVGIREPVHLVSPGSAATADRHADAEERQERKALINAEAEAIGIQFAQARRRTAHHARIAAEQARVDAVHCRQKTREAEDVRQRHCDEGSLIGGLFVFVAGLTCLLGEFVLTYETVPWLLSVPRQSIVGIAISLAPATALVLMKVVINRLLESPYRNWRGQQRRTWAQRFVMTAFLTMLGAGALVMLTMLGLIREQAASSIHALQAGDRMPIVDRALLLQNVVALSLFVTVAGAFLVVVGASDVKAFGLRFCASVRASYFKSRQAGLDRLAGKLEADAKALAEALPDLARETRLVVEQYIHVKRIELARALTGPCTNHIRRRCPLRERVDQILADNVDRLAERLAETGNRAQPLPPVGATPSDGNNGVARPRSSLWRPSCPK